MIEGRTERALCGTLVPLGGTWMLDTVGGQIEQLARTRSAAAIALGIGTALLKAVVGVLALALAEPRRRPIERRSLLVLSATASVVLILWGGANVLVGGLVLGDIIAVGESRR